MRRHWPVPLRVEHVDGPQKLLMLAIAIIKIDGPYISRAALMISIAVAADSTIWWKKFMVKDFKEHAGGKCRWRE